MLGCRTAGRSGWRNAVDLRLRSERCSVDMRKPVWLEFKAVKCVCVWTHSSVLTSITSCPLVTVSQSNRACWLAFTAAWANALPRRMEGKNETESGRWRNEAGWLTRVDSSDTEHVLLAKWNSLVADGLILGKSLSYFCTQALTFTLVFRSSNCWLWKSSRDWSNNELKGTNDPKL